MTDASPTRRRLLQSAGLALAAAVVSGPLPALAAPGIRARARKNTTVLKKYNVTVRRFDPAQGMESGEEFVLPVDCIDEEHAVSSAMSNAIGFTPKTDGMTVRPVAFVCLSIRERA